MHIKKQLSCSNVRILQWVPLHRVVQWNLAVQLEVVRDLEGGSQGLFHHCQGLELCSIQKTNMTIH